MADNMDLSWLEDILRGGNTALRSATVQAPGAVVTDPQAINANWNQYQALAPQEAPSAAPQAAPTAAAAIQQATAGGQQPQQDGGIGQGILNFLGKDSWGDVKAGLGRVADGLMATGSSDPAAAWRELENSRRQQALLQMKQQDDANPRPEHLGGGVFLGKDEKGSWQPSFNPLVAKALMEYQTTKDANALQRALQLAGFKGNLSDAADANKNARKQADEALPLLQNTNSLIERMNKAKEIVGTQGTAAQIAGLAPSLSAMLGSNEAAKNQFLQGLTVDETLLNTAKTKGAISDREMALFKSPIPDLAADREKVWKPWLEQRLEALGKLQKFYQDQVNAGNTKPPASQVGGPSAGGAGTPGSFTVPGLSPKASQYFQ